MDSPHLHPTNDDDDEEEDDIHTISSSCLSHNHNDRPSPSSLWWSHLHHLHHAKSDTTTTNTPSFPSVPHDPAAPHDVIQHHHPDGIGRHSHYEQQEEEEESDNDDTTTTTLEYPVSMNSSYSHRDALSASGSYGADMSFVTAQTMASPFPTTAVERGAHMAALDESSSSVLGHSTVAHTIASSSQNTGMTHPHHQYFFHSSFLHIRHSTEANDDSNVNANAIQGDHHHQPNSLPHSPSLPFKGTDLTSESMFLGMEYDTDYIKTTLNADSTTKSKPLARRIHRNRMVGCVVTLVALILVVAIGGVLCTFATTCPGLEPLSSRSSSSISSSGSGSGSSNTVEDQYDDTAAPSPSPLIRINPTANSNIATTSPTRRPVVSKTDPPTKPPASKFPTASPVKNEGEPTNDNQDKSTENNENTPENTNNNDPEPTASPTKEPTNDINENTTDLPVHIPTAEPVASSPNDNAPPMMNQDNDDRSPVTDDTVVPTTAPTFLIFMNDDDQMMNTEDDDNTNNDDRRIRIPQEHQ